MAEAETVTYRGNCHCGDFVFETKLPELKSAFYCNCSICAKKGYLWLFPGDDNVKIVKGSLEGLTAYTFGPKKLKHLAHAIQGLACWDLENIQYDGAALGEPFEPPVHKGEVPEAGDGEVVYTGSCHCGAVTVAAATKPLDEASENAIECNCSSCERIASIWIYSPKSSVVLSGDEANIGKYGFNNHLIDKTFCKTCGVGLTNVFKVMSEEQVAAMPERTRDVYAVKHMYTGVNARTLHGVDLAKLKTKKVDGLNRIPGDYVNP
ncbi:glutathione-dependent formaldehyde-activating enzyme [Trichoderma cornu-damae]|uniref:Glutathione-dependent formaldehyde-activating enzyme n=1 Tax=Trichoderma cornu-damae TaxID=654480 RepID=A0A9P8QIV1_9HYPO|nr:glutathione-dependent formaldehyde-activating enzyme [Trichoderma cornu-damae]